MYILWLATEKLCFYNLHEYGNMRKFMLYIYIYIYIYTQLMQVVSELKRIYDFMTFHN